MEKQISRLYVSTTGALVIGIIIGLVIKTDFRANAQSASTSLPFPMEMRVGSNLYLQTSAEYQAACFQAYRCAADRLRTLVASRLFTHQKPAVIIDLDETVFDNSSFQTYLYRTRQEYTDALWANYEQNYPQDVTLIPGAKQFIAQATELGVSVVFLSNRMEKYKSSTISALQRLQIAGQDVDARLFLKADGASSDKTSRRDRVAAQYQVLLILGDNLRDFSEVFVAPKIPDNPTPKDIQDAIASRKAAVDLSSDRWGTNWFILPNPVYGEWDKLIKVDPLKLMHPTSMTTQKKQ